MVNVHRQSVDGAAKPGGRLHLLLSDAGWEAEPWTARLPRLLEPMGVRALEARSGAEAGELIRQTRIDIAVVDLGLPLDASASPGMGEGGVRILELLRRLPSPPPTVVIKPARTMRDDARSLSAALKLGAFAVLDRPRETGDVELLLEVLRRCLVRHFGSGWPGNSA